MPYYLAPYIGAGTISDPYRPRGSDQPGWSAIDLRPDSTTAAGRCLLYLPVADADPQLREIALDKLENISGARLTALRNELGLPGLAASRFDALAADILRHPPSGGWQALRPTGTRWEVWLGDLLWSEPYISGGASDTFNRANETPLAAPWVKSGASTNVNLNSNRVELSAGSGDSLYYYTSAASTPDHYSQVTLAAGGAASDCGPACRILLANITGYFFSMSQNTGIYKFINGSASQVQALTFSMDVGSIARLEVQGTTLRAYEDGSQISPSGTDTSISSANEGPGMFFFSGPPTAMDNWSGADLFSPTLADNPPMGFSGRGAGW